MFFDDHAPPHFHAYYGEYQAVIDIQRLCLIAGNLPGKALELVLEWATTYQTELVENWNLCQKQQQPAKIEPLK